MSGATHVWLLGAEGREGGSWGGFLSGFLKVFSVVLVVVCGFKWV